MPVIILTMYAIPAGLELIMRVVISDVLYFSQ